MTVNQLSIFVENRSGVLVTALQALKDEGIRIVAATIADTSEYGICRIICDSPEKGYEVLKNAGVAVSLNEVFALKLGAGSEGAGEAITTFAREGISIAYFYFFLIDGAGVLFFRTDNMEKAREVIADRGLQAFKL